MSVFAISMSIMAGHWIRSVQSPDVRREEIEGGERLVVSRSPLWRSGEAARTSVRRKRPRPPPAQSTVCSRFCQLVHLCSVRQPAEIHRKYFENVLGDRKVCTRCVKWSGGGIENVEAHDPLFLIRLLQCGFRVYCRSERDIRGRKGIVPASAGRA